MDTKTLPMPSRAIIDELDLDRFAAGFMTQWSKERQRAGDVRPVFEDFMLEAIGAMEQRIVWAASTQQSQVIGINPDRSLMIEQKRRQTPGAMELLKMTQQLKKELVANLGGPRPIAPTGEISADDLEATGVFRRMKLLKKTIDQAYPRWTPDMQLAAPGVGVFGKKVEPVR